MHAQPKEPKDKNGFGYLLWLMLGGPQIHIASSARNLETTKVTLSHILQGRHRPTQSWLAEHHWRALLKKHYPIEWARYEAKFETLVAQFNAEGESNLDFGKAGKIMRRYMAAKGDDAEVLEQDSRDPSLSGLWSKVLAGDETLGREVFQRAATEFCRLYDIGKGDGIYQPLRRRTGLTRAFVMEQKK